MATFLVYRATCTSSGKAYVGCTRQGLERRRAAHEAAARTGVPGRFYDALRRFGARAFRWEVLATYPSATAMFLGERHFITQYQTQHSGYNTTSGGHAGHLTLVDRLRIHRARNSVPRGAPRRY